MVLLFGKISFSFEAAINGRVCVCVHACVFVLLVSQQNCKANIETPSFFLQKCTNHICTSQNEISLCLLKGKGVTSGNWLIQGRVGWGVCGGGGADKVPGMNSLSGEVAILPLSGIIIIFIIITTQTPLFCGSGEAKIIGFFPTNNTFTPELN